MTTAINEERVYVTWTFEGLDEPAIQDSLKKLDVEVHSVELDKSTGQQDVTFCGTEANIREFLAFAWDMEVDSPEVNEVFEYDN